ncbi:hypothetical protein MtrunA17_Chr2g0283651 [Medicago truncatula]|uniref:Uncharacterized protein n=1 Tax=Medicago truncatula TaxID=3880 RepID=A0A396J5Z9_MEDTR|nr:hypothetical protein MtrunA17_Chr2g0283651 [Medicago truncatula]
MLVVRRRLAVPPLFFRRRCASRRRFLRGFLCLFSSSNRSSLRFLISFPSTLSPPFYCKVCSGFGGLRFQSTGSFSEVSFQIRRLLHAEEWVLSSILYCCLLAEIDGCRLDLLLWFHNPERVRFC